jgi:hypothetical protein
MWPGRVRSRAVVFGSASARTVAARSVWGAEGGREGKEVEGGRGRERRGRGREAVGRREKGERAEGRREGRGG